MKTKVYYCRCTKNGRGYWELWSAQDECNYMYSTEVAPTLQDAMVAYAVDHMKALCHFEFQGVVYA